ncbi:8-amino-7-oxononanoate synthase [Capnocytophaga sp.]|uniref:aminotransferase class I/II-fold pyridoxal phosphate-dependent enzyme n=1 Tax=Capnocytophaga sp. TaxID=44737 RepID=UPI0026DD6E33|nr:8-amino-7-oxononanoate synthase [Capnocytophaga sp.]MDO5105314.1 8-amino-7-oxononanoate synthase [Capnocytophaga sp.]
MKIPPHITKKLEERTAQNALRSLKNTQFEYDFYSNDYLGFATSDEIKKEAEFILKSEKIQNGSTGSRLISGNFPLFELAENEIKNFHNAESALLFNSGYDANIGFFSSIPNRGDIILYDNFIHASIRDGISLSLAQSFKFKHNDLEDLEQLLKKFSTKATSIFIATESVFSMDGDSPDLVKMSDLATKYNAFLVVDEAHALGIFGFQGSGLIQQLGLEKNVFARIVTYGKALGCHGASVLCSEVVKKYLINFARSFIYTTAMSPHSVATLLASYNQLKITKNTAILHQKISLFKEILNQHKNTDINLINSETALKNYQFIESNSAIQAVILSGNDFVKEKAAKFQKNGFGIIPILSPTVEKGKERLRICLHSYNTDEEIKKLLNIIL